MKKILSFPGFALICILVIGQSFALASAPIITGPTPVCPGSTGNVYTTEAGYSNYVWNVSAGGTITAGGGSADHTVTVTWNTPGAQAVSVNYDNPPGTPWPSPTVYNVTVKPMPDLTNNPLSKTICNMMNTNIQLTSGVPGTSFTWTAIPSSAMISGYGNGSGSMINQMLMNFGFTIETVTYAIIPTANGCNGNTYNYVVTINPTTNVSNSPLSKSICSNSSTNIILTSNVAGTTFSWTASGSSGISGYSSGSGSIINQVLVNPGSSPGTVTYSITPFINGCTGTVTNYTVTVYPLPAPTVSGPTPVCDGSAGNVYSTQTGKSNYVWTVSSGGAITGGSASSNCTVTWNSPGSQWVHVNYSNSYGCSGAGGAQYPVNVDSATLAGSVTGGTVISLGSSTDTLVLTGAIGTVLTWQKRPGNDPFADIPSTSGLLRYTEVPETDGSWEYRAEIRNGSCTVEYSIPDTVIVVNGPVARSWNGSLNGNWSNPSNWSPAGTPASMDDVTIPAGALHTPVVNINGLSCHNLHISQDATLIITPGISLTTLGEIIIDGP
ncbi:MAG: hypothetical protein NTX61_08685 [Bacteroidetes bacterium]|nr:hypothetical protein [Bacteroidota bacterium]